jgi:hypothetical protein
MDDYYQDKVAKEMLINLNNWSGYADKIEELLQQKTGLPYKR